MTVNLTLRSRLALTGGLLGLVGTGILTAVLFDQDEPGRGRWWLVVPLIVGTPYAMAIGGAFIERAAVRGAWLLAGALTSLVFTVFLLFSVGVVLLPATVVLLLAAGRTLLGRERSRGWGSMFGPAGAVLATALLIGSLLVLAISPTTGCSQTIRYPDGSRATRAVSCDESLADGRLGGSASTDRGVGTVVGWSQTSGVTTGRVAGLSVVLLASAVLVLVGLAGAGRRGSGGGSRATA